MARPAMEAIRYATTMICRSSVDRSPPNNSLERTHKDSSALAYATAAPRRWAAQLRR